MKVFIRKLAPGGISVTALIMAAAFCVPTAIAQCTFSLSERDGLIRVDAEASCQALVKLRVCHMADKFGDRVQINNHPTFVLNEEYCQSVLSSSELAVESIAEHARNKSPQISPPVRSLGVHNRDSQYYVQIWAGNHIPNVQKTGCTVLNFNVVKVNGAFFVLSKLKWPLKQAQRQLQLVRQQCHLDDVWLRPDNLSLRRSSKKMKLSLK